MPDLPTITVTQEQADKLILIFGDVASYRAWLRRTLRDYVKSQKAQQMDVEYYSTRDQNIQDEVDDTLPEDV